MGKGWIGVDLDGTLAKYTKWQGPEHIGPPVPRMLERVLMWLKQGKKVKLFTARASTPEQIPPVRAWLDKLGLQDVEITNVKDHDMIELWDDRAIRVIKNVGTPVRLRKDP